MIFDIAPVRKRYRGIERALSPGEDFLKPETKQYFKILLDDIYKRYIDVTSSGEYSGDCETLFRKLVSICREFRAYNVGCEMIAYDILPIDSVFGTPVELYGIDVVCDECESLLSNEDCISSKVKKHLNMFGLLDNIGDVKLVLDNSDVGRNSFEPCWVYKIKI